LIDLTNKFEIVLTIKFEIEISTRLLLLLFVTCKTYTLFYFIRNKIVKKKNSM